MVSRADIERVLRDNPGMSAREIARACGVDRAAVNSLLYRHRQAFRSEGESPPRWYTADLPALRLEPPAVVDLELSHPAPIARSALYSWQQEALNAWEAKGRVGIVEAVTGAGKTRVGTTAIGEHLSRGGRSAVIVPTIELLHQWKRRIDVEVPGARVGLMGDGSYSSLLRCDVLIATANSARENQLGLSSGVSGLIVADECHRLGSEHNQRALEDEFEYRLGLTATLERSDGAEETVLLPYFGSVVFRLAYRRAIDDGVVARFKVALIPVNFSNAERTQYDELTEDVKRARSRLILEFGVPEEPFEEFLRAVNRLRESGGMRAGIAAGRFWSAFTQRRTLLAETAAKYEGLARLGSAMRAAERSIVFTQTIAAANRAAEVLRQQSVDAVPVHSEMDRDQRRSALEGFEQGITRGVVAPRVLDEGVDVPEADLGVILAASRQRRQMIQRMGRVLRPKADGRFARFAIFFVAGTSEDPAGGAHEAFLDEVTEVAEEVRRFNPSASPSDIAEFLRPQSGRTSVDAPSARESSSKGIGPYRLVATPRGLEGSRPDLGAELDSGGDESPEPAVYITQPPSVAEGGICHHGSRSFECQHCADEGLEVQRTASTHQRIADSCMSCGQPINFRGHCGCS